MGGIISSNVLKTFTGENNQLASSLEINSEIEKQVIKDIFRDLNPGDILDAHCHVLGTGDENSGCCIHPKASDQCRGAPSYLKVKAMKIASGLDPAQQGLVVLRSLYVLS